MRDFSSAIRQLEISELLAEERGFHPLVTKAREELNRIHNQIEEFQRLFSVSPEVFQQAQWKDMLSYLNTVFNIMQKS